MPPTPVRTLAAAGLATMLASAGGTLPAAAADWIIDYDESRLGFVAGVGGTDVPGSFGSWRAEITFDETDLGAASAVVTIDMASADTGDGTRDGTLRGTDFFAVTEHPEGRFESTAFRGAEGGGFEMDGLLTMRGTSREVTIPFTLSAQEEGGVIASGAVTIDRTEWGIGQGEFSGDGTVAYPVEITLDVAATPEG